MWPSASLAAACRRTRPRSSLCGPRQRSLLQAFPFAALSPQRKHNIHPCPGSLAARVTCLQAPGDAESAAGTPQPLYLPFKFGAEFEVIIRPKAIANLDANLELPSYDGSSRKTREFNLCLLKVVTDLLSRSGMPCNVHDLCSNDPLDYSKWNATLDASVSKKHIRDGFVRTA